MKHTNPTKEGLFNSTYNYEPLESCAHCGSLHLIETHYEHVECQNCGSVNYTNYTNIFQWIDDEISKNKNSNPQD